jgi:glycosyltransferase involved in cell wall biosynthesis
MASVCYVVITPARDEEQYLPATIASMCAQTLKPWRWLLVNDGSRDGTARIMEEAAARHPWITALHRENRGFRQAGGGVVDTFYAGYDTVADGPWGYVVKFDGDLAFGPDYFEKCFREFEANPKLGIGGGLCSKMAGHMLVPECPGEPAFHVRGPTKIYRRECFAAIGGLLRAPGWDTVDQIKANMLGWQTRTFAHIPIHHQRPTGGSYGSWNDRVKNGLSDYITGYHPVFMFCKCVRRFVRNPLSLEAPALGWGFLKGYLRRIPQVPDLGMIGYLRDQQWRALTFRSSLWS